MNQRRPNTNNCTSVHYWRLRKIVPQLTPMAAPAAIKRASATRDQKSATASWLPTARVRDGEAEARSKTFVRIDRRNSQLRHHK